MTDKVELPRIATGKRPRFFADPASDHLLGMVLELAAELSAVYARLDTLERALIDRGTVDPAALAAVPSPEIDAARTAWQELLLQRLFQSVVSEAENGVIPPRTG